MIIDSPLAMLEAGRAFAATLHGGELVTLSGGLGAGKTLFCKGVLEGLGYRGDVPSPTYNIMNQYAPPDTRLPVIHADLYRLNSPDELEEVGLLDSDDADTVRTETRACDGVFMAQGLAQLLAARRIPHPRRLVQTESDDAGAVRAETRAAYHILMT